MRSLLAYSESCLTDRFGKGRGTQTFFAHVQNWGEVDQLIQADVFGGVSTPSCLSKRYMQSFMDDDSRGLFLSREVRSLSKVHGVQKLSGE